MSLQDSKDIKKVKETYYKLAKEHHPDGDSNVEEIGHDRFSEVTEAYKKLLETASHVETAKTTPSDPLPTREFGSGAPDWGGYWYMLNFYQNTVQDDGASMPNTVEGKEPSVSKSKRFSKRKKRD